MTPAEPSRARLLELASRFAREIHRIEPPEQALAERIDYVVWGRKEGWARVGRGEWSELELRTLLLDHLDYECADVSGTTIAQADPVALAAILAEFDQALFGRQVG